MFANLEGWKTLIVSGLAVVYSGATFLGVVVPEDERQAINTGIIAIAMLILRLVTTGPSRL